jgi:putative transposon-encoded protein
VAGAKGRHRLIGKGLVPEDREQYDRDRELRRGSVKFEVHGSEVLEKQVKQSGNSGRIYLPPTWVGKRVKIIRLD